MKIDIKQILFLHPRLRELLQWVEEATGLEPTITSLYRIGDPGVHGCLPVRGADIRCRDKNLGLKIVRLVDLNWSYDKKRPNISCALLHGEGWNLHIHLQVHDMTGTRR